MSEGVTHIHLTDDSESVDKVDDGDCVTSTVDVACISDENPLLAGISMCGSTSLLWRVADLKMARQAGVIGSLVGSLSRQPRQNTRLGRPLELLDEEARLLAEDGKVMVLPTRDEEVSCILL